MSDRYRAIRATIGRSLPRPIARQLLRRHNWQRSEGVTSIPWLWSWLITSFNDYRFASSIPAPTRLLSVDPSTVDWLLVPRYLVPATDGTYVYGGGWDRAFSPARLHYKGSGEGFNWPTLVHIQNFTFFRSLKRHFHDGVAWPDTELYRTLSTHEISLHYRDPDILLDQLAEIDQLYDSIAEHGYRSQRELLDDPQHPRQRAINSTNPSLSEVMVNIGRDGEVIFCTGRHRFIIARLLDIASIPVRVHVRHSRWQQLRHRAIRDVSTIPRHLIDHPDLADIVAADHPITQSA